MMMMMMMMMMSERLSQEGKGGLDMMTGWWPKHDQDLDDDHGSDNDDGKYGIWWECFVKLVECLRADRMLVCNATSWLTCIFATCACEEALYVPEAQVRLNQAKPVRKGNECRWLATMDADQGGGSGGGWLPMRSNGDTPQIEGHCSYFWEGVCFPHFRYVVNPEGEMSLAFCLWVGGFHQRIYGFSGCCLVGLLTPLPEENRKSYLATALLQCWSEAQMPATTLRWLASQVC